MSTSILFSDTPEHFYQQLKECIQQTIKDEITALKQNNTEVFLKKDEVCKMLKVSKPTVDTHVEHGYYKKHYIGSRVFYNKQEILDYLTKSKRLILSRD
jgi:predicted DNA-binding transcriptional regulator AlpA